MTHLRRMRLRRADGRVYLDRWGIQFDRLFGIYLHRMEAADPGEDLHDHPWTFASLILSGGYVEERANTRDAPTMASMAEAFPSCDRGVPNERRRLSIQTMRLDECHRITRLRRVPTWTLVLRGPRRRRWGFYLPSPTGYVDERTYDETVRAQRRDLWSGENIETRPW